MSSELLTKKYFEDKIKSIESDICALQEQIQFFKEKKEYFIFSLKNFDTYFSENKKEIIPMLFQSSNKKTSSEIILEIFEEYPNKALTSVEIYDMYSLKSTSIKDVQTFRSILLRFFKKNKDRYNLEKLKDGVFIMNKNPENENIK